MDYISAEVAQEFPISHNANGGDSRPIYPLMMMEFHPFFWAYYAETIWTDINKFNKSFTKIYTDEQIENDKGDR